MINASINASDLQSNFAGLNDGTTTQIIHLVENICKRLAVSGLVIRPFTPKALVTLYILDEVKKQNVLADLTRWHDILASCPDAITPEKIDERTFALKALKIFNFKMKSREWEDVCNDEIIEIYNPQGIQLYRSLNFFKTCGYSILDLCVNEWYVLWERPSYVIERLHHVVSEVLAGVKKDTSLGVGPHLIRETFDDGTTQPFAPRSAIVEFRNIYPAYNNNDEIIGFMVTSKGKVLSEGNEALKLDFI